MSRPPCAATSRPAACGERAAGPAVLAGRRKPIAMRLPPAGPRPRRKPALEGGPVSPDRGVLRAVFREACRLAAISQAMTRAARPRDHLAMTLAAGPRDDGSPRPRDAAARDGLGPQDTSDSPAPAQNTARYRPWIRQTLANTARLAAPDRFLRPPEAEPILIWFAPGMNQCKIDPTPKTRRPDQDPKAPRDAMTGPKRL